MLKRNRSQSKLEEQNPPSEKMRRIISSLRLEGIVLSKESIEDLKLVEAGKLSKKKAIARVLARGN